MGYIEGQSAGQVGIHLGCLEDEISQSSPARVIAVFVEALHIQEMGFIKTRPAATGRPAYDPRDLIKLYLYGYLNGIRSSRKLERECGRNVELFYLLGRLCPDHNTIADFRKDNRKALKKLFVVFVSACKDMKLLSATEICLDGTTVRAVNGRKQSTSKELSHKKLAYATAQLQALERYLDTLDENDLQERSTGAFQLDLRADCLPDVQVIKQRIAFHEDCLRQMEETGKSSLLFTDREASMMPAKEGGIKACYNVQAAVDTESHMLVDFTVTAQPSDRGQLLPVLSQVQQTLGVEHIRGIADKGYESAADIERCLMQGIIADVGFIYDREERVFSLSYQEAEITAARRASTKPEDIGACLHAGVLPDCYQNSTLRIEVQSESAVSCFIRHEDGRVTCPMGRELFKMAEKKHGIDYGSREACRSCPNRCTDSKQPKRVRMGPNTTYVPVIMYGDSRYPLQQIPDVSQNTPYNHFGIRKRASKRVMLFMKRDIEKQKLRQQVSEHPFGTIKHADGFRQFLCKGKEMTTAEFALGALSYNLRRAMNIAGGVEALIKRFTDCYQGRSLPKSPITAQ